MQDLILLQRQIGIISPLEYDEVWYYVNNLRLEETAACFHFQGTRVSSSFVIPSRLSISGTRNLQHISLISSQPPVGLLFLFVKFHTWLPETYVGPTITLSINLIFIFFLVNPFSAIIVT